MPRRQKGTQLPADTNGEATKAERCLTTGKATTRARGGERNRKAGGARARALTPPTAATDPSARTPTAPTPAREQPADATQSRGRQSARRRPGNEGGHDASEPPTAAAGHGEEASTHGRRKRVGGDAERKRRSRAQVSRSLRFAVRWIEGSRRTDEATITNCAKYRVLRQLTGSRSVQSSVMRVAVVWPRTAQNTLFCVSW